MCGINGIFAYHSAANIPSPRELLATRERMFHRGPDAAGEWWSADRRLALGHRRLSIIDLSERGGQPMESADGRYVVVYNGELYNYKELRRRLESHGRRFRSTSDTEVLLHLYDECGPSMVDDLVGMFAFALWDNRSDSLFLARDPYGIKPLYTSDDGWTFRFASQVKALLAGGGVGVDPEPAGIVGFHLLGHVPEPFTLYRSIRQLPAGYTQWIDAKGVREPRRYVSIAGVLSEPAPTGELKAQVRTSTFETVKRHLLSDVEVGVFLSAGVDSSAILALAKEAGLSRAKAITLAFEEFRGTHEDEVPLATKIANRYDAEHIVRFVTRDEFRDDIPKIFDAMDQPSIDGINAWFVSKAAREAGLKVALSGLGGDELLAGYPSFRQIPRWVNLLAAPAKVPGLGRAARRILQNVPLGSPKASSMLEYGGTYAGAYLLRRGLYLPHELYAYLAEDVVRTGLQRLSTIERLQDTISPDPGVPIARVSALESCNYMRNQLLRDADWAGMAHSLEIRTPLVDIRLLRQLSGVVRVLSDDLGKRLLGNAPKTPLPESVLGRDKTGFLVPASAWNGDNGSDIGKGQSSRRWALNILNEFVDARSLLGH